MLAESAWHMKRYGIEGGETDRKGRGGLNWKRGILVLSVDRRARVVVTGER